MRYRKTVPFEKEEKPSSSSAKKRLILLCLNFILIFGIYYATVIRMQWKAALYVFVGVLTVLLGAVMYLRHGIGGKLPTPEQLTDAMTLPEKEAFIAKLTRDRERARLLTLALFPMILTLGLDIIYMNFFA